MKKGKSAGKVGLQLKLTVYLFLFSAVIITGLWLIYSVFLDDIYMAQKTEEIKGYGDSLSESIDSADFSENADAISSNNRVCIFVYNVTTGEQLLSCEGLGGKCDLHKAIYGFMRPNDNEGDINTVNLSGLIESVRGQNGSILFNIGPHGMSHGDTDVSDDITRSDSEQSVIYARLIENGNNDEILIAMNSIITPMASTVGTLNSVLIYMSVFLVVLAVIFAFIISINIAKPISEINKSAKELAKGNYNVSFDGGGYSEAVELSDTLNYASLELNKVDKLKNDLLANISHDLRTPLTMISGYAEMMRDIPSEMSPENLQIIIDESSRMSGLVNDILDISKLQSGNIDYEMKPVELTKCIQSEMVRYNKLREIEGYSIDFIYDSNVSVKGDASRLMQVLYNLVNNAVTHTGDDKKVVVRQSIMGKRVRISVSDTGEGIDEKDLPLIWDRYYKVDKSHRRASTGSGLGLSIVKTIIEAHKGSCGAESALNKGSTFWFELDILQS